MTGLLRPTYRGAELTARGLALREWLLRSDAHAGPEPGGSMLGFRHSPTPNAGPD
ncbi:MAG: hypothetical protein ACRDI3_04110 [Actinomycetota bacterium]